MCNPDESKRNNSTIKLPSNLKRKLQEEFNKRYKPGKRNLMQDFLCAWRQQLDTVEPSPQAVRSALSDSRNTCEYRIADGLCRILLDCSFDEAKAIATQNTCFNKNPDEETKHQRGLFVPNNRCRTVWGRKDLIAQILNRLADPNELSIFSLSGAAGYGKTEAASVVAQTAIKSNLFADVLWVTARQTELVDGRISATNEYEALNWNQFLNQIAHQLACPIERVQQRLREEKLLVVLDNAETSQVEDILANLVKMLNPSRALLTSRLKTNPQFVGLIPIQGLDKESSHSLLRDEATYKDIPAILQASDRQLDRVYELSCGAPLALHFIVGRVLDDRDLEPVLSALEKASGEVEAFYQFSLETAWQRINNTAKNVLRYMGRADASVTLAELSGANWVKESDWHQVQRDLKRWYLIEEVQDTQGSLRYDLHPWVRSSVRGELVDKWQPSLQDLAKIAVWKFGIDL
jgi:hypothetical protein